MKKLGFGVLSFVVSAVVSGVVTSSTAAYALNDRISPLNCMANSGVGNVIAVSGALKNNNGSAVFVQCGYEDPSFYNASTVTGNIYSFGGGSWMAACIQNPVALAASCGASVSTIANTNVGSYNPSLSEWTSMSSSFFPYILFSLASGDQVTSISVN